jgi:hypothetical protein
LTPAECATIRQKFDVVLRDYPGLVFLGVFVDASGQAICGWGAPSLAVVNDIITKVEAIRRWMARWQ